MQPSPEDEKKKKREQALSLLQEIGDEQAVKAIKGDPEAPKPKKGYVAKLTETELYIEQTKQALEALDSRIQMLDEQVKAAKEAQRERRAQLEKAEATKVRLIDEARAQAAADDREPDPPGTANTKQATAVEDLRKA
eukprot:5532397-Alexandrium_andersonii.AAC.1